MSDKNKPASKTASKPKPPPKKDKVEELLESLKQGQDRTNCLLKKLVSGLTSHSTEDD